MEGLTMQVLCWTCGIFCRTQSWRFQKFVYVIYRASKLCKIEGIPFNDHLSNLPSIVENTNIAELLKFLDIAETNNLKQEDLPTHLVVITDLELILWQQRNLYQ
jgi:hypothetical protein